jgi:hypothetical protein
MTNTTAPLSLPIRLSPLGDGSYVTRDGRWTIVPVAVTGGLRDQIKLRKWRVRDLLGLARVSGDRNHTLVRTLVEARTLIALVVEVERLDSEHYTDERLTAQESDGCGTGRAATHLLTIPLQYRREVHARASERLNLEGGVYSMVVHSEVHELLSLLSGLTPPRSAR